MSTTTPRTIPVLAPQTVSIDSDRYVKPKPPKNSLGQTRQQLDAERDR